jgi:hypothetical protein
MFSRQGVGKDTRHVEDLPKDYHTAITDVYWVKKKNPTARLPHVPRAVVRWIYRTCGCAASLYNKVLSLPLASSIHNKHDVLILKDLSLFHPWLSPFLF